MSATKSFRQKQLVRTRSACKKRGKWPLLLFIYRLLVSALVYLKLITLSVGFSVITSADLQYFQKKMKCATVPYNRAMGLQGVCLISGGVYSARMEKPCATHAVHFFFFFTEPFCSKYLLIIMISFRVQ